MRIEELTSSRVFQLIGRIDTLVIPIGTVEAHGPHCSVMSDVLIPEKLAEEIEQIAGDRVFIGPTIPYGHTWELKDQPGSHTVPGKVLSDYVFEVIKGFQSWKIKYVVLLNGHGAVGGGGGGNIEPLHDAAERASELGIKTIVLSWWAPHEAIKEVVEDAEGHAGEGETSLLWYFGEKYVDKSLIPKQGHDFRFKTAATLGDIFDPELNRAALPRAYSGKPFAATREKGRLLNERVVKALVQVIDAMRSGALIVL